MEYIVNGKEINSDSSVNQKIKREFVANHVYANVTDMVDDLMKYSILAMPMSDGPESWRIEEFRNYDKWLQEAREETEDDDYYPELPYEYYIVSEWLGRRLINEGELVLERSLGYIWGRQGCGQAILLDGVIDDIAYKAELLKAE